MAKTGNTTNESKTNGRWKWGAGYVTVDVHVYKKEDKLNEQYGLFLYLVQISVRIFDASCTHINLELIDVLHDWIDMEILDMLHVFAFF
ncbi:hypothetical protein ACJX0J_007113, partial [Zea mays]